MRNIRVEPCAMLVPLLIATSCSGSAQSFNPHDAQSPLRLVRSIELSNVKGRIDHMALGGVGKHLFIAEYGNGSVDDLDLASGKVLGRITGLHEPQGIAWLPAQQEIVISCGDGLVTFYRAADRQRISVINLGSDADNIRIDRRNGHVVVGYGSGGLAVIDPAKHRIISRLLLPAHPEAFELVGAKVFVNVPEAHKIVIADIERGEASSTLGTGLLSGNFPMASDSAGSRIAVAFRTPGTLSVLDAHTGSKIFSAPVCGDADDLYFRGNKLVVVCGSGSVELIEDAPKHAAAEVTTRKGARTGLLDTMSDHLFVAVPAQQGPAAIWELSFR